MSVFTCVNIKIAKLRLTPFRRTCFGGSFCFVEMCRTIIALVHLTFGVKNREETANEMMRMYSDDLVATLLELIT